MSLKLVINTAVDPFGFSLERNGFCLVSIKQSSNRAFSESLVSLVDQHCRLNNVTLNSMRFHLHTLKDDSKIDCLKKMYEHIYSLKQTLNKKDSPYLNYTIQWYNPKTLQVETSSFYGESIQQVLGKFFYGKRKKNILFASLERLY